MYFLKTDRLQLNIANPNDLEKLAHRFDPTSVVTEIILDNHLYLTASEPHNVIGGGLHSAGRGLSCEFKFDNFEETAIGDYALKLGVGLLKKPDTKPFDHHREYEKLVFKHELLFSTDKRIGFRTKSIECNGYQTDHIRIIEVNENTINMNVTMKNTGTRPITFKEYCHNFFSIDGLALSSDYELNMHNVLDLDHCVAPTASDLYEVNGTIATIKCHKPTGTAFTIQDSNIAATIPHVWELYHKTAKVSIKASTDFRPSFIQVWSYDHMICPELFIEATIKPGEATSWNRTWTIDTL